MALVAVALPAFVVLYLRELAHHDAPLRTRLFSLAGMLAVALGLTLAVDASLGTLFVYAAVPAGLRLPAAARLHLSPGTTRNHLSAIMQKLDAHTRIEAIRVAEERGWL